MARVEGLSMGRSNRTLLLVALVAGLAAAVLVFVALANQSDDAGTGGVGPGGTTVATVVAAQDIAAGTKVTQEMLQVINMPSQFAVKGAYEDALPVVGQVTSLPLAEGEAVTPSKIGTIVENAGIDHIIRPTMRGMAVQVDEVAAVGGNLRPGAFVDLHAVWEGADGNATARVVLQDVEVIAVAQEAQEPLPVGGEGAQSRINSGDAPEDFELQPGASTLTLSVLSDQALKLALVQETATKVFAAVRPYGERGETEIAPLDLQAILD
jgi:pilus assembly protein CpaB